MHEVAALTSADSPLAQTLAGITGRSSAQLDYLMYLFLQAVVVFIWWPKDTLPEMLAAGTGPSTLLAAVLAAGVGIAWFSVRAGAQELSAPGQPGLREWVSRGSSTPAILLASQIAADLILIVHLLALSSPLILMAFAVSGASWSTLGWCAITIVCQAMFYHMAARAIFLSLGHLEAVRIVLVRALVLATYLLSVVFAPAASHLALSARLLHADPGTSGAEPALAFMLIYLVLGAILAGVVLVRLGQLRRGASRIAAAA